MSEPLFTLAELERAREVVGRTMPGTPQYAWPLLGERIGAEVWLKHENHTPIGAFKVRGGLAYLDVLCSRNSRPNGLITATRGNHGQSIPYAASRYELSVTVVVPVGNSVEKNKAMQAWGAKLIVHGRNRTECLMRLRRALDEMVVGGIETTIPLHQELIAQPSFIAGDYDIHWLQRLVDAKTESASR